MNIDFPVAVTFNVVDIALILNCLVDEFPAPNTLLSNPAPSSSHNASPNSAVVTLCANRTTSPFCNFIVCPIQESQGPCRSST